MPLIAITAHDSKFGIGKNGTLPWRNLEDWQNFKAVTSGHTVIMGSTTYRSIGKPLPNRRNIVLSRTSNNSTGSGLEWVEIVSNIEECQNLISEEILKNPVFILGWAQVYRQYLNLGFTDELWISHIPGEHDCDTFFPDYRDSYVEFERTPFSTFEFVKYRKKLS